MDDAADARCELEEAEQRIKELEMENLKLVNKKNDVDEDIQKMCVELAEFRITKAKLETIQSQNALQIQKYRQEIADMDNQLKWANRKILKSEKEEAASTSVEVSFAPDLCNQESLSLEVLTLDEENDKEINPLLDIEVQTTREVWFNPEDTILELNGEHGDVKQSEEYSELVSTNRQLRKELNDLRVQLKSRDALKSNWTDQIVSLEKGLLLVNQINKRDNNKWKDMLSEKESELDRSNLALKLLQKKFTALKRNTGRAHNVSVPIKNNTRKSRGFRNSKR